MRILTQKNERIVFVAILFQVKKSCHFMRCTTVTRFQCVYSVYVCGVCKCVLGGGGLSKWLTHLGHEIIFMLKLEMQ